MASSQRIIAIEPETSFAGANPASNIIRGRWHGPRNPLRGLALKQGALASAVLTVIGIAIHGYHPYAEDGGPYFVAVLKSLHPGLYPASQDFATAFAHYSFFTQVTAALIRITGLEPATAIFLFQVLSVFTTILGGWVLAARCYSSHSARCGAASLLALWLTLPVAGTSLLLVDPYFTARSISTPCSLFALAAMLDIARAERLDGRLLWSGGAALLLSMTISGLAHPLMTAYTLECLVLLFAISRSRRNVHIGSIAALCTMAIAAAGLAFKLAAPAAPDTLLAARTRTYWFLQNWHWYEIAGLLAPLLLLHLLTRRTRTRTRTEQGPRWLTLMAIVAGFIGISMSLLFVRESSASYQIARLQPLRVFHLIYLVMIVLLGAFIGERLRFSATRQSAGTIRKTALAFLWMGAIMFCIQLRTFPASAHIELPWSTPRNGWEQAFFWIRKNTPPDALFALDAQYIDYPGQDAQYFSAIAQRSALPDYAKDGGLASLSPHLAEEWVLREKAQTGLNRATDSSRIAALRPFGVSWLVLPSISTTELACPFNNNVAKVCQIDNAQSRAAAAAALLHR